MFKYLICIKPLGFMYGSAGAFLSPENLVGRSGSKFPPEAATLSGLFFRCNQEQKLWDEKKLSDELCIAGPFWGECDDPEYFYVPIPWTKIIADGESIEWKIKNDKWSCENSELKAEYKWQRINFWNKPAEDIRLGNVEKEPWKFEPILHPRTKKEERCTLETDGLFLEYAVQMDPEYCLVYLSTHALPEGWYKFGGENHVVEINSVELLDDSPILELLKQKIENKFALITPGVWGSNRISQRFPENAFSTNPDNIKMLTDKPIPYRYRVGDKEKNKNQKTKHGRLGRGRYSVPAGSVYVLDQPIDKTWWEWNEKWFPNEGFSLKKMGCGLCLPIDI